MRGVLAAALCGVVTAGGIVAPVGAQSPPNVLLIYADDLGYGDLGSYGHPTLNTPNLDRLAAEGIRFTDYYSPSPLCSPSRASLLTGRVHYRTGVETWIPPETDVQLGPAEITLATLLKGAGYQTAMTGKWHLNGGLDIEAHAQPDDHGFDHWLALHGWPVPHNRNPRNFFRNGEALGEIAGYTGQIVVDEAITWLGRRDEEQPFFLYVPLVEPHSTIANPDQYNAMYSEYTRGEPDPFENGLPAPPDNVDARGPGEYWANITYMDHQIGRLLAELDRLGVADETFVFFASDNGAVTTDWRRWWEVNIYGSTGGFRGRKHDLYEGGIRVPAIARWPGRVAPGSVTDAPVVGYDLLPTIAAIVGVGVPTDRRIDGEDLTALLRGEDWQRERPIYWEFDDDQGFHYALRDGDWKMLADRALQRVELYDLATSRFEVFDVAAQEPERTGQMVDTIRRMAAEVEADPISR